MDFSLTDEQKASKQRIIQFAKEQLNEGLLERDQNQDFPYDVWKKCAEFGIQSLALPQAYGGAKEEVDFMGAMLGMEGLGYGCDDNGLAFGLNAMMWTVMTPILHFGNEEQKKKYLIPAGKGEVIGAHALTEPEAGSDVFGMQMTAEKKDGGYLLNGKKHLITFAPICDFALVLAKTNPKLGKWGVSAFLVDKGTPGYTQSAKFDKMGMRCIPIGELEFKDCWVPESALLGKEGLGFSVVNHSLEYDRCCILASQLGAMERQLEKTISFAKERKQYGQPISKFQAVANRIVDMRLRLETSRLLLYKTAWLKHNNKPAMMEAALLKLHLSESFLTSSLDVMRTHGGKSFLTDNGLDRDFRDAVGGILYAGTSDIQRNIIAQLLGL